MDEQPGTPTQGTPTQGTPPVVPAPGFNFDDFLNFRYLITPGLITIIYVVGAVLITLAALASLAGGGPGVVAGVLVFVFGNLYWRVILEFVIVLFRINDGIQAIERRGRGL